MEENQFDHILRSGGVEGLLDTLASYLRRKTDFFQGEWKQLMLDVFNKQHKVFKNAASSNTTTAQYLPSPSHHSLQSSLPPLPHCRSLSRSTQQHRAMQPPMAYPVQMNGNSNSSLPRQAVPPRTPVMMKGRPCLSLLTVNAMSLLNKEDQFYDYLVQNGSPDVVFVQEMYVLKIEIKNYTCYVNPAKKCKPGTKKPVRTAVFLKNNQFENAKLISPVWQEGLVYVVQCTLVKVTLLSGSVVVFGSIYLYGDASSDDNHTLCERLYSLRNHHPAIVLGGDFNRNGKACVTNQRVPYVKFLKPHNASHCRGRSTDLDEKVTTGG